MKRLLACLLAMLMLVGMMASCDPTTPEGENGDDITTEAPEVTTNPLENIEAVPDDANVTKVDPTSIELIKGKMAKFKVIYGENSYEAESPAQKLATAMFAKFFGEYGVAIEWGSDLNVADSRDTCEILIGATNREESNIALQYANGGKSFVVKAVGNKLVINAFVDENLSAAVDYFFAEIVEKKMVNKRDLTVTSEDDYSNSVAYPRKTFTVAGFSYKPYTIVVPKGATYSELRLAKRVQAVLANQIGALVNIVYDNESGHAENFEILVGKTNRTTISVASDWEYAVALTGAKIELLAGSVYSYESLGSYVDDDIIFDLKQATLNCGEIVRKNVVDSLASEDSASITEKTGEIRMVVHNVWGWNEDGNAGIWNYAPVHYNSATQRNLMMAEVYNAVGADIVMLQEYTNRLMRRPENSDISPIMESLGYAQILGERIGGVYTATPIFYKTDKFELLDSGVTAFTVGGGHDKFATWGVFKQKSDGKIFGAVSVHMAYQGGTEGENYRLSQVPVVMEIVDSIRTKNGNCPVVVGGDFNCTNTSNPFNLYISNGCKDVQGLAQTTDNGCSHFGGTVWDPMRNIFTKNVTDIGSYANAIDHLIVKGDGMTFKTYDYLTDNASASISDHMALVVDFDLD